MSIRTTSLNQRELFGVPANEDERQVRAGRQESGDLLKMMTDNVLDSALPFVGVDVFEQVCDESGVGPRLLEQIRPFLRHSDRIR